MALIFVIIFFIVLSSAILIKIKHSRWKNYSN